MLRGFFLFCGKSELRDKELLADRLSTLPKHHDVCHAVHAFVDAIDRALGGPIDEPATTSAKGKPLAEFMHTLRTLGLPDYAVLCELTLRDEGHPLGDYMMRMLGFHLIANLLSDDKVRASVGYLDKLRFTEFLPYGEETSTSFKKLYADSLTEQIVDPWASHPWQAVTTSLTADVNQGEEASVEVVESMDVTEADVAAVEPTPTPTPVAKPVGVLGFSDDCKDLPFLQLGDLLIRDDKSSVYAILSASCDLQFTPESVSETRPRERDDTVLVLPGSLRKMGAAMLPKTRATTSLIQLDDTWYSIDWFDRKLLGLPHYVIRTLFESSGYKHVKRLQVGRALELQHTILSWVSRIGLEVQPPLPMDLAVTLFGKQSDGTLARLGDVITQGALLFHLRDKAQPVLVFRQSTFTFIRRSMEQHAVDSAASKGSPEKMRAALATLTGNMVGMKVPVVIPQTNTVGSIKFPDPKDAKKSSSISSIGFRIGRFTDPPTAGKDVMFCISVELA